MCPREAFPSSYATASYVATSLVYPLCRLTCFYKVLSLTTPAKPDSQLTDGEVNLMRCFILRPRDLPPNKLLAPWRQRECECLSDPLPCCFIAPSAFRLRPISLLPLALPLFPSHHPSCITYAHMQVHLHCRLHYSPRSWWLTVHNAYRSCSSCLHYVHHFSLFRTCSTDSNRSASGVWHLQSSEGPPEGKKVIFLFGLP